MDAAGVCFLNGYPVTNDAGPGYQVPWAYLPSNVHLSDSCTGAANAAVSPGCRNIEFTGKSCVRSPASTSRASKQNSLAALYIIGGTSQLRNPSWSSDRLDGP